ncbi:MAG TPA: twin-arginine translocase subunit TatC [Tepidisphaeraceae bacterium]|nr:twin-arginine translocase subunit TatC [Tepidisphaeraceae bacterium]
MTTATKPPPGSKNPDPDDFRMTIGEHLDELRVRLIRGLAGGFVALLICLPFGRWMMSILLQPLLSALDAFNINPATYTHELMDPFMCWLWVSIIAAAFPAGPWFAYQMWQFIATGLYPHERKYVTRYIPLSIALLFSGFAFVYFVVLPLTLRFFLAFLLSMPAIYPSRPPAPISATTQPTYIQAVATDPPATDNYRMWFNTVEHRLKINIAGNIESIPFGGNSLIIPQFTLSDYLSMVFRLMITFGLCFQMPLVVLALASLGIVTIADLKRFRRYVYFAMGVLAVLVSPGDAVTATVALLIPLIFLYEFGVFLARVRVPAASSSDSTT